MGDVFDTPAVHERYFGSWAAACRILDQVQSRLLPDDPHRAWRAVYRAARLVESDLAPVHLLYNEVRCERTGILPLLHRFRRFGRLVGATIRDTVPTHGIDSPTVAALRLRQRELADLAGEHARCRLLRAENRWLLGDPDDPNTTAEARRVARDAQRAHRYDVMLAAHEFLVTAAARDGADDAVASLAQSAAEAAWRVGAVESAVRFYETHCRVRATTAGPDDGHRTAVMRYRMSQFYFGAGDLERAALIAEQARAGLRPSRESYHLEHLLEYRLGTVRWLRHERSRATEHFRRAFALADARRAPADRVRRYFNCVVFAMQHWKNHLPDR